ncbi:MAG: nucleotidyltransferase domain-containing protein [Victivallales bacterium]|nr:nucleotidyltransferase domain-containing protein [Victivallales bacterium]
MTKRDSTLKLIKKNLAYLSDEFGIEKIGIFGSVAKEIENTDSDIDIVVKLKKPIGLKFIGLVEYLEKLFNKKVDVLTLEGIKNIKFKDVADDITRSIIYV